MPELPEVESVRRLIAPALVRKRIARVELRRPDLRQPFPRRFVTRLTGQTVLALTRRAKYLLAELSSGETLLMHLGMSGSFRVASLRTANRGAKRTAAELHDHVVFHLSSGAAISFNDPRRFGVMDLVAAGALASHPALSRLGPEPLADSFDAVALARACRGKRTSLKAALLDQRIVAGLGNIYVSEALHRAGVSPKRRAATLVDRQGEPRPSAHALVDGIKASLRDAIANRHRADGDDRFLVYGHDGERCPRRGCGGVVKRIVQNGRASFFCPACQR